MLPWSSVILPILFMTLYDKVSEVLRPTHDFPEAVSSGMSIRDPFRYMALSCSLGGIMLLLSPCTDKPLLSMRRSFDNVPPESRSTSADMTVPFPVTEPLSFMFINPPSRTPNTFRAPSTISSASICEKPVRIFLSLTEAPSSIVRVLFSPRITLPTYSSISTIPRSWTGFSQSTGRSVVYKVTSVTGPSVPSPSQSSLRAARTPTVNDVPFGSTRSTLSRVYLSSNIPVISPLISR